MQVLRSVPEQGQLAVVRQRRYVVTDVRSGVIGAQIAEQPQHLVSLTSIEDDALGEELQVIWEIEPGARAFEKMELPEPKGFDQPAHLEAFLDAVRWGAASIADTRQLQSPFRSGIEIESYQLDPVVRAIQMPRVNLLIADDVGLGKTIESGMVVLELMLRHRANRVLVVCPSSLQIKWRDEMLEKFGLDFVIVDSALIKRLRRERGLYANPWTHFPRLITSMDYLKREYPLRMFREAVAHDGARPGLRDFDILIVDEAHNAAPSGTGNFALDSQRTQALREIGKHFEHKLFLTATPHNGYKESFSALLELLDDQRFARSVAPDPAQLRAGMVRASRAKSRTGTAPTSSRGARSNTFRWTIRRRAAHPRPAQVRRAVEMFVSALDRADRESGRALLQGLAGEHIYEAALTLMMRLVFLFFAEERDLLPITNPIYRENYAVATLHDQLREAADRLGEEVLERRYDAFPRLLAGFRAVHGGIAHDLAALPAYGGDL